jgi:hypothetical protein
MSQPSNYHSVNVGISALQENRDNFNTAKKAVNQVFFVCNSNIAQSFKPDNPYRYKGDLPKENVQL